MYLISFVGKLKRSGYPAQQPDKFISIYIQMIFQADPRPSTATIILRNHSVLAHGVPARCQSKWEIISKKEWCFIIFYKWEEIKEERKLLPPKLLTKSMAIFTVLVDEIQCPQFPHWRSLFSRLSRSRRACGLFFGMAPEFQSFNGKLLLLYCFLNTLLIALEVASARVSGAVPLKELLSKPATEALVELALHVGAGLPYAIQGGGWPIHS